MNAENMVIAETIFREYDIRGIAGKEISRESAFSIGRAFGALLQRTNPSAKKVSVGRDVRHSSPDLASGAANNKCGRSQPCAIIKA